MQNNTIVLIHGWGWGDEIWKNLTPMFNNKYNLLFINIPGYGGNVDSEFNDYSMNTMAKYVLKEMEIKNIKQAILAGFSMGAIIGCEILSIAPNIITNFIAIDGPLRKPIHMRDNESKFINNLHNMDYELLVGNIINEFTAGLDNNKKNKLISILSKTSRKALIGSYMAHKDNNINWLNKNNTPILSIMSKDMEKYVMGDDYKDHLNRICANLTYNTVEGTHLDLYTNPEKIGKLILKWLNN